MTTRRERIESRVDKRLAWAESAEKKGSARLAKAKGISDAIPFGQPLLVGHHSEGKARRDRKRIHSNRDKGFAELQKARAHESKAKNLTVALERSIYDDDPDAIEALEQRAKDADESAVEAVVANKLYRTGGVEAVRERYGADSAMVRGLETTLRAFPHMKHRSPFNSTGSRADARRARERIAFIKQKRERAAKAEASGGVTVERWGTDTVRVTFAEKPSRDVLSELRAAGFRFSGGSWIGTGKRLPARYVVSKDETARECPAHGQACAEAFCASRGS